MPSVILAEYTPDWCAEFDRTASELRREFGDEPGVAIEHVGSTSVPGLCAKPVIDVLLGTRDLAAIERAMPWLAGLGFRYVSEHESELPQRRYFVRAAGERLRANLHGVVLGSAFWLEHVAFRDALRRDAALSGTYAALKRELALRFRDDRPGYTAAKGPFIRCTLAGLRGSK